MITCGEVRKGLGFPYVGFSEWKKLFNNIQFFEKSMLFSIIFSFGITKVLKQTSEAQKA